VFTERGANNPTSALELDPSPLSRIDPYPAENERSLENDEML